MEMDNYFMNLLRVYGHKHNTKSMMKKWEYFISKTIYETFSKENLKQDYESLIQFLSFNRKSILIKNNIINTFFWVH